jgi:hypothetical protein
MFKKNTEVPGFFIGNFINATTGAVVVTGTPVEKRTLDGTVGDCTNAASYTSGDQGWKIDLAAGDLNADLVGLSFTLTDCLPICFTIKTVTKLVSDLVDAAAVSAAAIAAAVWNSPYTSYSTEDTYGLLARPLAHGKVAGVGASTITLDGDAVGTNNYYDGAICQIVAGTGAGQSRIIRSYVGSTKIATVSEAWATNPDTNSLYTIHPLGDVEVGYILPDIIDAASIKADAVTKIQSGLATPTNITAGTIETVTNLTNAPTNGDFTSTMKSSITTAVPTAAAIGTDAASKVLVTPAQKLVTDGSGFVTYANAAPPAASAIKTAIEASGSHLAVIKAVTDKLDTCIEEIV